MKLFKLAIIASAMVATVGCTTIKGWFNEAPLTPEQEQQLAKRNSGIKVPANYMDPKKSDEYLIPKNITQKPNDDSVTSPTTVLVILDKSWINQDDKHPAKIMLEKPDLVEDFAQFIKDGLSSYENHLNVKIDALSEQQYNINYKTSEETGFWFWESNTEIEEFNLLLNVKLLPHGRSGQAYVDVVDYKILNYPTYILPDAKIRKEAMAVHVLNDFMLELDYQHRVKLKKEKSELDVTLAMTTNSSDISVLVSQQEITYVFSQMEDILEQLGFDILEDDKLLHSYIVNYRKGEQSFWDSLFNSDVANKLDIPSGEYVIDLTTSINGVYIKFSTKDGIVLTDEELQQVYELIMSIITEEELEL